MNKQPDRLLVIQAAGLGYDFLRSHRATAWQGLQFEPLETVFPAVTCAVQASFRTAAPPGVHGMVANGLYCRDLNRPLFWEQSAALVSGPRIWEPLRARGKRVALLFWQQALGENVNAVLSPAPIHKHGGGIIESTYSRPPELYARLCRKVGRPFRLRDYWGPLASARASDWIAQATAALLQDAELAPALCLTYLPALDYDLQRYGPAHERAGRALHALLQEVALLLDTARAHGYAVIVFGDYAIGPATEPVLPNVALREAGLLATREVAGRLYPDFHTSRAFALADHEVAHVYIKDAQDVPAVRQSLERLHGVAQVMDRAAQRDRAVAHARGGELLLVAAPGCWLAYPWWTDRSRAPDYAAHVDIHNKPGYDPCELFLGWPPMTVSQNLKRIKGSHGRAGPDRLVAWAATVPFPRKPASVVELAAGVRDWLETPP